LKAGAQKAERRIVQLPALQEAKWRLQGCIFEVFLTCYFSLFLVGFEPDSQRYFDFHHAATDVLEAVNPRELKLGSASMASLIFLMDKFGL